MDYQERRKKELEINALHEKLGGAIHVIKKLLDGKPTTTDIVAARLWIKKVQG